MQQCRYSYCKSRTGTAGGTYTAAPAGLSINAATGAVNLAASTAGTYTVTYTIAAGGGCGAVTATASITITTLPAATISYAGTPYCQPGGTVTVTRTGTAGTYSVLHRQDWSSTQQPEISTLSQVQRAPHDYLYFSSWRRMWAVTATTSVTINAPSVAATTATATSTALHADPDRSPWNDRRSLGFGC
ncbi:MAG: hypothetical protein IPI88_08415 [Chitinophagaceae bacterium]|nr:hypothetical protein [Chitinophagaceae bacterium]